MEEVKDDELVECVKCRRQYRASTDWFNKINGMCWGCQADHMNSLEE